MDKSFEQTVFQGKHTDGQKAHEKMLNFTIQKNSNQNHSTMLPHTCEKDQRFIKKTKNKKLTINVGKDVEKREPSDMVHIQWNISHKRNEIMPFELTWLDLQIK